MRLVDADALMEKFQNTNANGINLELDKYALKCIKDAPTIEERKGKWTTEEVAELLFNMFGDDCACNFNNIDEWLPEKCKYDDTTCPNPKEKHGCWMQFLLHGGADMREQP